MGSCVLALIADNRRHFKQQKNEVLPLLTFSPLLFFTNFQCQRHFVPKCYSVASIDLQRELSSPSISSEECIDMLLSACEVEEKQLFRGKELRIIFKNYQLGHSFSKELYPGLEFILLFVRNRRVTVQNRDMPPSVHCLGPQPLPAPLLCLSELLGRFVTRVRHRNLDTG